MKNHADETYAVCLKEDNRAIGSIGLIKPEQFHTKVGDVRTEHFTRITKDEWLCNYK